MNLHHLIYHSHVSPYLALKDLRSILDSALAFNEGNNITGCLLKHENEFLQILEGEEFILNHLFEKIKKDERHHSVSLLEFRPVDYRYFKKWSMAFYSMNSNQLLKLGETIGISGLSNLNVRGDLGHLKVSELFRNVHVLKSAS